LLIALHRAGILLASMKELQSRAGSRRDALTFAPTVAVNVCASSIARAGRASLKDFTVDR
jgi:hypothetical protein